MVRILFNIHINIIYDIFSIIVILKDSELYDDSSFNNIECNYNLINIILNVIII